MAGTTTYLKTDLESVFDRITRRGFTSKSDQANAFDAFWQKYSDEGILIEDAFRDARTGAPDLENEVKKLRSELDRLDKAAAAKPTRKNSSPTKAEEKKAIRDLAGEAKKEMDAVKSARDNGLDKVKLIRNIQAATTPAIPAVDDALTEATDALSSLRTFATDAENAWRATRDADDLATAELEFRRAEDARIDSEADTKTINDALTDAQNAAAAKAEADKQAQDKAETFKKVIDEINKLKKSADETNETFKKATGQAEELRDAAAATTAKAAESARKEAAKAFTERDAEKTKFEKAYQDLSDSVDEAETAASSGDEAGLEAAQTKATEANDDLGKAEKAAAEKLTALKTARDEAVKAQAEDRGPIINAVKPYTGERFWLTALVAMLVSFVLILALAPFKEQFGVLWFLTAGLLIFLVAKGKPAAKTVLIIFVVILALALGFEHILPFFSEQKGNWRVK